MQVMPRICKTDSKNVELMKVFSRICGSRYLKNLPVKRKGEIVSWFIFKIQ